MDMDKVKVISINSGSGGLNYTEALSLLLIGLKLSGKLEDWNWVVVLAPIWLPFMALWFFRLIIHTFFVREEEEEK